MLTHVCYKFAYIIKTQHHSTQNNLIITLYLQQMSKSMDAYHSNHTLICHTVSLSPFVVTVTHSGLNSSRIQFPQSLCQRSPNCLLFFSICLLCLFSASQWWVLWKSNYQPSHYHGFQRISSSRFTLSPGCVSGYQGMFWKVKTADMLSTTSPIKCWLIYKNMELIGIIYPIFLKANGMWKDPLLCTYTYIILYIYG